MSRLRDVWAEGRTAFGVWIVSASPSAAELIASLGFDYIGIDCQHGLIAYEGMRDILLATSRRPVSPIVRVPANDDSWIGKALDAGAEGIIVPLVNSAADAGRAARACRFPPDGVRSYGLAARRSARADDRGDQLERPVLPDDRDACGPRRRGRDLRDAGRRRCIHRAVRPGPRPGSVSGRGRGTPPAPEHAEAVERIRVACGKAGVVPGIHSYDGAGARARGAEGFRLVTVCADASLLAMGGATELATARG
jgi:4-hydroxy-2-oxoheptanedioate aldolase